VEEKVKKILSSYKIKLDPFKDQFFLIDQEIIKKIVEEAKIRPNEKVVEIGAGLGFITWEIAKRSRNVLAIEIDRRFKPILNKLPSWVKVVYGDAWKILGGLHYSKYKFDKLISSLPYSLCEPIMHKFTYGVKFKTIVFVIPKKFFYKILNHPIFSAFYKIEKVLDVPKKAFYPIPRVNSVVAKITPYKNPPLSAVICQYLYKHRRSLTKNALVEALIEVSPKIYQRKITKNQARKLVQELGIDQKLLKERPIDNPSIYFEVIKKINTVS